jgi:tRNA1Val (adenine37-N6)-methyltransferase
MSNSYFKFKQFIVHQERSAMKVCTDSCILGAWSAQLIKNDPSVKKILDIGSGTGLLSLMVAQESKATIDAVEIDPDASLQSKENFEHSPWKNRLTVWNKSILQFAPHGEYDFIISNPPFFENDLVSETTSKNIAKHHTGMTTKDLVRSIQDRLELSGQAAILLPYHRSLQFEEDISGASLFIKRKLHIRQTPAHNYFRTIFLLSKKQCPSPLVNELTIHDSARYYTEEFRQLLRDYYLEL